MMVICMPLSSNEIIRLNDYRLIREVNLVAAKAFIEISLEAKK